MKYLKLLLIILFISCSPEKSSDLKLMDLFSNGMVLQQKSKTKIWGVSNANATINLESSWGVKSSTEADANGNWITEIDTPKAGGPYSMKITDVTGRTPGCEFLLQAAMTPPYLLNLDH